MVPLTGLLVRNHLGKLLQILIPATTVLPPWKSGLLLALIQRASHPNVASLCLREARIKLAAQDSDYQDLCYKSLCSDSTLCFPVLFS